MTEVIDLKPIHAQNPLAAERLHGQYVRVFGKVDRIYRISERPALLLKAGYGWDYAGGIHLAINYMFTVSCQFEDSQLNALSQMECDTWIRVVGEFDGLTREKWPLMHHLSLARCEFTKPPLLTLLTRVILSVTGVQT